MRAFSSDSSRCYSVIILVAGQIDQHAGIDRNCPGERFDITKCIGAQHQVIGIEQCSKRYYILANNEMITPQKRHMLPERKIFLDNEIEPPISNLIRAN